MTAAESFSSFREDIRAELADPLTLPRHAEACHRLSFMAQDRATHIPSQYPVALKAIMHRGAAESDAPRAGP